MSKLDEINSEMSTLAREIETLSGQLEGKRTSYERAKHAYEQAYSGLIITGKVEHPDWTQTDLEAHAITGAKEFKNELILAQAAYREVKGKLSSKDKTLDTVKERGWNLRQQLKSLQAL